MKRKTRVFIRLKYLKSNNKYWWVAVQNDESIYKNLIQTIHLVGTRFNKITLSNSLFNRQFIKKSKVTINTIVLNKKKKKKNIKRKRINR